MGDNRENTITIGLFCFGNETYFEQTKSKIETIKKYGIDCYVLTDNPTYFEPLGVNVIPYIRKYRSYHDKLLLVKRLVRHYDITIIMDVDTTIKNEDIFEYIKTYKYKYGITYIETLENHKNGSKTIGDMNMSESEWDLYRIHLDKTIKSYKKLDTIWEYFMVFNKVGFNYEKFFNYYEELQLVKEYCDLSSKKDVNAAGEGVSIMVSSKLSDTDIQRDKTLYKLISSSIEPNL